MAEARHAVQTTTEQALKMGLVPYAGGSGLKTLKAMRYDGSELILGGCDIPPGAVAYVPGAKVRRKVGRKSFDFITVQFYKKP